MTPAVSSLSRLGTPGPSCAEIPGSLPLLASTRLGCSDGSPAACSDCRQTWPKCTVHSATNLALLHDMSQLLISWWYRWHLQHRTVSSPLLYWRGCTPSLCRPPSSPTDFTGLCFFCAAARLGTQPARQGSHGYLGRGRIGTAGTVGRQTTTRTTLGKPTAG